MTIENNKQGFVMLWRRLERTRLHLMRMHKRYCIRRVCQTWFPAIAGDRFLGRVCRISMVGGYEDLRPPSLYPRRNREFLRALVATYLDIGERQVNLKALDEAYSEVFRGSTRINVSKKRPLPPPEHTPMYSTSDFIGREVGDCLSPSMCQLPPTP